MTAMMKTVIQSGTGRGADIGKPAAGKTGTTDDYRDAYFVGYTPDIVTGVWVGDDNNKQMKGLTGGTIPAKIWHDIMAVATAQYGNKDFDYPVIVLDGYNGRLIGDDDSGEEEEENTEEDSQQVEEQPLEIIELKPTTPADVVKNFKQQTTAPVTTSTPVETQNKAPIPMAVPESLR